MVEITKQEIVYNCFRDTAYDPFKKRTINKRVSVAQCGLCGNPLHYNQRYCRHCGVNCDWKNKPHCHITVKDKFVSKVI